MFFRQYPFFRAKPCPKPLSEVLLLSRRARGPRGRARAWPRGGDAQQGALRPDEPQLPRQDVVVDEHIIGDPRKW